MLLKRRRLPLNALRAFEVTGNHCHMRAAAEELGVTHGAISRQIRQLEEMLQVKLFDRAHNRLTLTSAGVRLLAAVRSGFDRITEGAQYIDPEQMAGPLQVATTPSIAANWLSPILGAFFESNPETEIRLQRIEPNQSGLLLEFDVAICYGHPGESHLIIRELFHERFFPVGNPQLLATGRRIRQPSDLLQFPLLHDHLQNWPVWLRSAAGIEEPAPKNMFLHDCFLAINAARQGYGIALADIMEVAEDLHKGTLIMLSDQTVPASAAVMLVRHPESREHLRARAFSEQVVRTVSQVRNQVY